MRKISLFDFCKRQDQKLTSYGQDVLNENGETIPFLEQASIITHYLQLGDSIPNLSYKEQAAKLLVLWNKIIHNEYEEAITFCA